MQERQPDFWRHLRVEFAAGPHWADRAVVLAYSVVTGLVVVGFTLLAEAASEGFARLRQLGEFGPWLTLAWTPALTVAVLWWTRRFAPGAQGSGIPQVVAALDDGLPQGQRSQLVSLRLSLHKIGLSPGGCSPGFRSAARDPPCRWARA